MAIPFSDAVLSSLNPRTTNPIVTRGSLIVFRYSYHKPGHDPQPLVLVTDTNYKGFYLRGINLHYLTFPTIKALLSGGVCENTALSYQSIKESRGNSALLAYRQYKKSGIQSIKKLNCEYIVNAMAITRSFDPNEIQAIRKSVRDQIRRMVNEPAAPSKEMPL